MESCCVWGEVQVNVSHCQECHMSKPSNAHTSAGRNADGKHSLGSAGLRAFRTLHIGLSG